MLENSFGVWTNLRTAFLSGQMPWVWACAALRDEVGRRARCTREDRSYDYRGSNVWGRMEGIESGRKHEVLLDRKQGYFVCEARSRRAGGPPGAI